MTRAEQSASAAVQLAAASCSYATGDAVAPHCFAIKDNRYDPLVGVGLLALQAALEGLPQVAPGTGIIALSDSGCMSHVARVAQGVAAMRPRQAFFARGGAGMIATYCSLALLTHGPCFSLAGGTPALQLALSMAHGLMLSEQCEQCIVLAVDYNNGCMNASALLLDWAALAQLPNWRARLEHQNGPPSEALRALLSIHETTEQNEVPT